MAVKQSLTDLRDFLDQKVRSFERIDFIKDDPVQVPHRFSIPQDMEIAGFFAAILSWGKRSSIINSCNRLLKNMDDAPYDFVKHHQDSDLKRLSSFVHRTFQTTDLLFLLEFLKQHYQRFSTLECAFSQFMQQESTDVGPALAGFHQYVFSLPHAPDRSRKHIATPLRGSACKRLNMFLRWMVRQHSAVDLGIWQQIKPAQLVCPLDVHVARVARRLGLLHRKQDDWKAALLLTHALRVFDPLDPVKYDFALFGMGIAEKNTDFF